jgi:hypothetical protein
LEPKEVTKLLIDAGWLEPDMTDGRVKSTQKIRIHRLGPNPTRCYVFTSRMWEGDE